MASYEDYQYDYNRFLVREAVNQDIIVRYLNEAILLEKNDVQGLYVLTESAIDTIKAAIKKILDTIKKMWNKFVARVNGALNSDTTYLNKYKDTIINKPFKSRPIEMYKYDGDSLTKKYLVPELNMAEFKEICSADSVQSAFISKYFPNLNAKEELKDQIEEQLKGGTEEVSMNMTDLESKKKFMFNFCANFKETTSFLSKQYDIIEKNQTLIESGIEEIAKEVKEKEEAAAKEKADAESKAAEAKKKEEAASTPTGNEDNQPKATVESAYSYLFESVITEMEIGKANTATSTVKDNVKTGVTSMDAKGAASSAKELDGNSSSELEAIQKGSSTYFTCCGNILMAKLTVAATMNKEYMKLLKVHVQDYVASEGQTTETK